MREETGTWQVCFSKKQSYAEDKKSPNHMNDLTSLYGQAIRISQELEQRRARAPELMPCADLADQLVVELGRLWSDGA